MIIWINGAFGSGKTTTAFELQKRLPNSHVYDPENIGYFLNNNLPKKIKKSDFQDYKQWREFNYEMLKFLNHKYDGIIIAPMTITNKRYYDEIIQRLIDEKIEVKHFILYASKNTLIKRLNKRLDYGDSWAKQQINRCIESFDNDIKEQKIMTDNKSINDIVEEIAKECELDILTDNRSKIRKELDRIIISLKHIR